MIFITPDLFLVHDELYYFGPFFFKYGFNNYKGIQHNPNSHKTRYCLKVLKYSMNKYVSNLHITHLMNL